jgi:signal transduction histidine kinase
MGLGLAIVKETVLAHGGDVFAGTLPDGGAVFGFFLPLDSGGTTPGPDADSDGPEGQTS